MTRFPITFKVDPLWRWLWRHGWEPPVGPEGPLGEASVPDPVPWRSRADADSWREAVEQLVEAVQAKDVASRMKDSAMREATAHRAQAAIEMVLEDWCGTPPRRHPWPWPGPPPWVWAIISALNVAANSVEAGSLRDGLMDVAAQALQKAGATGARG